MRELCNCLNMSTGLAESSEDGTNICSVLHRYYSELIFLIYPNEESLLVVVKDASCIRPFSIKSNSLQEPVSLLEQEVIVNQMFPFYFSQRSERIVLSSQLSSEAAQRLSYFVFNLLPLFFGKTWTKRIFSQVPPHSYPCALDQLCLFFTERRSVKFSVIHVTNMLLILRMSMILFYYLIKQVTEDCVRIVASGIDSNTRVDVLASREDRLFEGESKFVL